VRDNYGAFAKVLPDTKVYYAVKANSHPEVLSLLNRLGSSFDVASVQETQAVLATGCTSDRISYGNTIKKESEIATAFKLGVTLFAVDCEAEVDKIARAAPGSRVICRIHCDGTGAEWPLSRKFGCEPEFAADILERAQKQGLIAYGISFHVGSQQHNVEAWDRALPRPRRSSAPSPSAASRSPPSISVAASRPNMCARRRSSNPTARRSSARYAAISATVCRRPSSSPAAAWSAMPA